MAAGSSGESNTESVIRVVSAVWRSVMLPVLWCAASTALLIVWHGWRPGPLDGPAWRPALANGLAIAVFMVACGIVGTGIGKIFGHASLGASLVQLAGAVIVVSARRRLMTRSECQPSGSGWSVLGGVIGLAIAWPIVQIASMLGAAIYSSLFDGRPPVLQHESLRQLEQGGFSAASMAIVFSAVIAAPFFEEVLYRGVLQQTLRAAGVPRVGAIVVTAALFAVMHLGDGAVDGASAWSALPALFVLGLLFGVLYERTGRLAAPIAAHALFNIINILVLASGVSS